MKICILTHSFPRNSKDVAAAFMKGLADGLVDGGNEVVVLTPFDNKFKRSGDRFKIVTYRYIWPEKWHLLGYSRTMKADVKIKKISFLLLPLMILFGCIALFKTIKKDKIDLVTVHWIIPNGLIALFVCKLTNIPYTVTIPGTDAFLAEKFKFFGLVSKLIANNSKAVFSNSPSNLKKILSLGIKPKLRDIITYPVDIDKFRPTKKGVENIRRRHSLKPNDFVVLALGRLVYKKGFNYLIDSMSQVLSKSPNTYLVIGGEGDLRDDLQNQSEKLKLSKNVIFAGTIQRDEASFYYNLTDIMVTPSIIDQEGNIDGRPVVILESMACGKPQVVSDLPGISDSLINNENALLVPQKNSKALGDAIIKLIESPNLRKKMGQLNRKMAEEKFSIHYIGKIYTEYFKRILNGS